MPEEVDINKPVEVNIRITGPDLDTCLYAMDEVRERMEGGRTSGAVHVAHAESYFFGVKQLGPEPQPQLKAATRNQQIQVIYRALLNNGNREVWLDPEDAIEMARDIYEAGLRLTDG